MSRDASAQPGAARVGKYLMLDVLGEGAFGKVRLAVDESDGTQYAMKIMEKSHIKANELTLQVRREIAVMKAMRHRMCPFLSTRPAFPSLPHFCTRISYY